MANIKEVVKVARANTNTSTVTRIVIPKSIAAAMDLEPGQQLLLEYQDGEIKIKKF